MRATAYVDIINYIFIKRGINKIKILLFELLLYQIRYYVMGFLSSK